MTLAPCHGHLLRLHRPGHGPSNRGATPNMVTHIILSNLIRLTTKPGETHKGNSIQFDMQKPVPGVARNGLEVSFSVPLYFSRGLCTLD
jgi:hypothetical protein